MTNKIASLEDLKEILKSREGKKIVFTNGCFDILHVGHIYLLEKAKSFGDILIVGLNTDSSIKRIKGEGRPIIPQEQRAKIISALETCDHVVFFDEDTPCEIISEIKPDIHVKGGDYNPDDYEKMPEAKIVKEYGGEVKIVELLKNHSTTSLIEGIKNKQS